MPARIIRPPCTRYQSECRLTVWRIASRIAWAAASSDMVMVRLHSTNVHRKIPRRESAVLATLTRQMMTGVTLFSVQGKSFPSVALRLGAVLSGVRRPLVRGARVPVGLRHDLGLIERAVPADIALLAGGQVVIDFVA